MKKDKMVNYGLLLLRIGLALLMLPHGIAKAKMLLGSEEIIFLDPLGIGAMVSLILAVLAEVGCSLLILVGWKVRWTVLPLLFTMLVAIFVVHINDPWVKIELAALYLLGYMVLAITGGGYYSMDTLLSKKEG